MRHAREFLNYFANTYTERQLDSWVKVYLPAARAGHIYTNTKLKSKIVKGEMPMVFRGEVWKIMIGNDLKLNA